MLIVGFHYGIKGLASMVVDEAVDTWWHQSGDSTIFDTILAPLCKANPLVARGSVPHTTPPNIMRTHMFRRWQNHDPSVSKFGCVLKN